MSLDFWSPARAPEVPAECDDFDPPQCTSVYWLPLGHVHHGASLRCALDGGHLHDPFDSRHGRGLTRWTTAEAARSLADFGPRPTAQCSDCSSPAATRGLCAACAGRELANDDRETETENVA